MSFNKRILAIDFGTKLIGIAISDSDNKFAVPYCVIDNNNLTFKKIKEIIDEDDINLIVIGFPKTINDYVSQRHQLINDFKNNLDNYLNNKVEILFEDESYSTVGSESIQKEFGIKASKIKKTKDMGSAALILESYLKKLN